MSSNLLQLETTAIAKSNAVSSLEQDLLDANEAARKITTPHKANEQHHSALTQLRQK